jgi:hypothetical protein
LTTNDPLISGGTGVSPVQPGVCFAAHVLEFLGWTPVSVKLFIPPRQSRGNSLWSNRTARCFLPARIPFVSSRVLRQLFHFETHCRRASKNWPTLAPRDALTACLSFTCSKGHGLRVFGCARALRNADTAERVSSQFFPNGNRGNSSAPSSGIEVLPCPIVLVQLQLRALLNQTS